LAAGASQKGAFPLPLTVLKALLQVCLLASIGEVVDERHLIHLAGLVLCLGADAAQVRCTQQRAALVLVGCADCTWAGGAAG
jgi:hypothetical protein